MEKRAKSEIAVILIITNLLLLFAGMFGTVSAVNMTEEIPTDLQSIDSVDVDGADLELLVYSDEKFDYSNALSVEKVGDVFILKYCDEKTLNEDYETFTGAGLCVEKNMAMDVQTEENGDETVLEENVRFNARDKKVAILDTGIDLSKYSEAQAYSVIGDEHGDDNSHGTLVADALSSIIDTNIVSVKVADSTGKATIISMYLGIEKAIEEQADYIIISMTSEKQGTSPLLEKAIEKASSNGIVVVVAAGNDNSDASNYSPANIPGAITVGTCKEDGTKENYSNYGDVVDYYTIGSYGGNEGTSISAALAAGYLISGCQDKMISVLGQPLVEEKPDAVELQDGDSLKTAVVGQVYWKLENGTLHLSANPGTGYQLIPASGLDPPWYSSRNSITSVEFDTVVQPISTKRWFYRCSNLTTISNIDRLDTSNVTNMSAMFSGCSSLSSLDVSNFDTSNVTNMGSMFYNCGSMQSLDLSNFDTSKVTDMSMMFSGCSSLTNLDVSNFDTSKITSTYGMFSGCSSLPSLDISSFDTSKVTNMNSMFYGCSSLTNLDVSNLDVSNATNLCNMFSKCSGLLSLDLSNFNTSKATLMYAMFSGCSSLTNLDVSNFDTANVTDMGKMFANCSGLKTLDISNFDTSKAEDAADILTGCTSMEKLVTQRTGQTDIVLPVLMVEQGTRAPIYSIMPSESKTLVIYKITATYDDDDDPATPEIPVTGFNSNAKDDGTIEITLPDDISGKNVTVSVNAGGEYPLDNVPIKLIDGDGSDRGTKNTLADGNAYFKVAHYPALTKQLNMESSLDVPDMSFEFKFVPKTAAQPSISNQTITYTSGDEASAVVSDGVKSVTKESKVNLDGLFTEEGTFVYDVYEEVSTVTGGKVEYSKAKYSLEVSVQKDPHGNLYIESSNVKRINTDPAGDSCDISVNGAPTADKTGNDFIFTNTYEEIKMAPLTISKKVEGKYADLEKAFNYDVTVNKPAQTTAATCKAKILNSDGTVADSNVEFTYGTAKTVSLKDGQKLVFDEVPIGAKYTAVEQGTPRYTPSAQIVENGAAPVTVSAAAGTSLSTGERTIGANENSAGFTNTCETVNPTGIAGNNNSFVMMIFMSVCCLALIIVVRKLRTIKR